MGTNFYFHTTDKTACEQYKLTYRLTDEPSFGYEIHIAKTSGGWLPLFQAHIGMRSVRDIETIAKDNRFQIMDEYYNLFDWNSFKERVLEWCGGYVGGIERNEEKDFPRSHLTAEKNILSIKYFTDEKGYEFTDSIFS